MKKETGFMSNDKPNLKFYEKDAEKKALSFPKNKTLWDILEEKIIEYSDIPALEYFKKEISRPNFMKSVEIWARTFKAMGVNEQEIVPIYGPFFPDIFSITLALNSIGAISYFLKLEISAEELNKETSESKIAVVYDGMWNNVANVFKKDRFKKIIVVSATDSMVHPKKEIVSFFNYIESKKEKSCIPKTEKYIWVDEAKKLANYYTGAYKTEFVPNSPAFITSSSGTSINGVIKGTVATNEAAISKIFQADAAGINYNVGKKCLTNLPPTASTSLCCLFFLPLFKGMTVINEPRLCEQTYYNQIMSYKPQVALMTGSFWESFFKTVEQKYNQSKKISLDFFEMPIIGGEGVTVSSLKKMNELMEKCNSTVSMYNGYGLSEIFSVLSVEKTGVIQRYNKPIISVGIPFPGVTIGVFDKNGKEMPYNSRGELWVKDSSNMIGYYGKEELTKTTKKDGWIHTGDIAEIDEEGLLYIWGRINNSVNLNNNQKLYMFDIEIKLMEDPEVKEVIVNPMKLNDKTYFLVAHILLSENVISPEETILERLDKKMQEFLPEEINIQGYKIHRSAFPISPTTAKKDRKSLIKDLDGYTKKIDGEFLDVSFEKMEDGYKIIRREKEEKKNLIKTRK